MAILLSRTHNIDMTGTDYLMHAAATLPNLLSMISMFRAERAHRKDLTIREFQEWLDHHHHEELKEVIFRNAELTREVGIALQEDHKAIADKLSIIADAVFCIASKLDGVSGIAKEFHVKAELTNQACMMLSAASAASIYPPIVIVTIDGIPPVASINGRGWDAPEPDFVLEDLEALLYYGFLEKDGTGSSGYPNLRVTRLGKRYAQTLNPGASQPVLNTADLKRYMLKAKVSDPGCKDNMPRVKSQILGVLLKVGSPTCQERGVSLVFDVECSELPKELLEQLDSIVSSNGFSLQVAVHS